MQIQSTYIKLTKKQNKTKTIKPNAGRVAIKHIYSSTHFGKQAKMF